MPRIYTAESDALDFCKKCMPSAKHAEHLYSVGTASDNRGNCYEYEADHPDYDDFLIRCHNCNKELNKTDN